MSDCIVIDGATAWMPDGRADDVTVVIDAGRIVAAGDAPPDLKISGDTATLRGTECRVVDGAGKVLTAGLIDPFTRTGVIEIDLEDATADADPQEQDPVRAALRVSDAYNPRSTAIPVTRLGGVTSVVVVPAGGLVSGQSAWADLAGDSQSAAIADGVVSVQVNLGATASRAEDLMLLRELLGDARRWPGLRGQAGARDFLREGVTPLDLDALQPVIRREVPLVVRVDRASDIEAVLRLAKEEQVRVVVAGGAEGWLVAGELAAAKVPVIVDPLVYGAGSFDQVHGREDNAALLAEAGVPVLISTFDVHNVRTLRVLAGNAVRGGLDADAAIAAITSAPADAFGMVGYGRLEAGAVGNVVLWSGDPLEIATQVELLVIDGREIALESRQTWLRDKYRTVPGTPLAPLDPTPAP